MVNFNHNKLLIAFVFAVIAALFVNPVHSETAPSFKHDLTNVDEYSDVSDSSSSEEPEEWERKGGFLLYLAVMFYVFVGFELICDAFFVPALNIFCEKLHLTDDFAGATLMAFGGNAPDIFSGIAGVLVIQSDVGPGTIVGSLLFNHLCIIGCSVLAVGTIKMNVTLLVREMAFYFVSIVLLFVALLDLQITVYESSSFLFTYVVYVVVCYFTPNILKCCKKNKKGGIDASDEEVQGLINADADGVERIVIPDDQESFSDQEAAHSAISDDEALKKNPSSTGTGPKAVKIPMVASDDHNPNPEAEGMKASKDQKPEDSKPVDDVEPLLEPESASGSSTSPAVVAKSDSGDSTGPKPKDRALAKVNTERLRSSYASTYNEWSTSISFEGEEGAAPEKLAPISASDMGLNYGQDFIMHGFLMKKSRWYSKLGVSSRTWQKRWFVLGESFWYCRNPLFPEKRVEIPLWKAWSVHVDKDGGDLCSILIHTPSQTYVLRAPTPENARRWCSALDSRVKAMKHANPDLYLDDGLVDIEDDEDDENLFRFPSGESIPNVILWVLSLPYAALFTITIPDVRKSKCRNLFVLTFIMVLAWLAVLAYILIWVADRFAFVVGIPPDVMGLTISAIGASLPSLFSSVIAAKQGMANMAIANAFGANLCSILLALGIPIFLLNTIKNDVYVSNSNSFFLAAIVLSFALLIFVIMSAASKWTLRKGHGIFLLILYVVLLAIVVVLPLEHVFGL